MKSTNKFLPWTAVAVVCLICSTSPLMAAESMFLNIPGIKGESTVSGYQNQINVYSFSWGASYPSTNSNTGVGGGTTNKTSFVPLTILKNVDSASTPLYLACAQTAKLQDPVVFTIAKTSSSGSLQAFYTITLTNVYVQSVQASGATGGTPTESLSLIYGYIQWSYTPFNSSGQPGTPIVHSWDIIDNTGN